MTTSQNWRTLSTHVLDGMLSVAEAEGNWELAEDIEAELENREAEDNEMAQHYDSPDIYDTMGERPTYSA